MARKTTKAIKAAKKGKAAKVKPRKAQKKADAKASHGGMPQWTMPEIEEAFRRFEAAKPEPQGELVHVNPFTLLVAVVLSAQATDAGVNKATPALFALADTPEKMAALGEGRVRELIKTIVVPRKAGRRAAFFKVSKRREMDISIAAAAFCVETDAQGIVTHARLAFGGVAVTPSRAGRACSRTGWWSASPRSRGRLSSTA